MTNQALTPGIVLQGGGNRYRIEKVLGQGSFGITYLATTHMKAKAVLKGSLGEIESETEQIVKVAVKEFFMKETNSRSHDGSTVEGTSGELTAKYRKKFRKEAENLSHLNHPNIVKVLEVFDANNTTYYAMQYIPGQNLDDYIKSEGHLGEGEAIGIIRVVAEALRYMHKRNMLHLDLKPKNIMLDTTGIPYLIDFGLSKQYDDNGEPESSTTIGLGTPGYAPIEQANYRQDGSFPATLDIYALGATLYKMVAGKTPPVASDVLSDGLPIRGLVAVGEIYVSAKIMSALEKAMQPSKKYRPQSVSQFLGLLDKNDLKKERVNENGAEIFIRCPSCSTTLQVQYEARLNSKEVRCPICNNTVDFHQYRPADLSGTVLQNRAIYRIEDVLEHGDYDITYLATASPIGLNDFISEEKVIIKEFFMKEAHSRGYDGLVMVNDEWTDESVNKYREKFLKVANNYSILNHPNIVKVLEVFNANNTCYCVMQYIKGQHLDDYIRSKGSIEEQDAIGIIKKVAEAVRYMHEMRILHLNLNPSNILLDNKNTPYLKGCFFDLYDIDPESDETIINSFGSNDHYRPLEQNSNWMKYHSFSVTLDVYALGATLYRMVSGCLPPMAHTVLEEGILHKPPYVSTRLWSLIKQSLQTRREDRPQSVEQFLNMLNNIEAFKIENALSKKKTKDLKTEIKKETYQLVEDTSITGNGVLIPFTEKTKLFIFTHIHVSPQSVKDFVTMTYKVSQNNIEISYLRNDHAPYDYKQKVQLSKTGFKEILEMLMAQNFQNLSFGSLSENEEYDEIKLMTYNTPQLSKDGLATKYSTKINSKSFMQGGATAPWIYVEKLIQNKVPALKDWINKCNKKIEKSQTSGHTKETQYKEGCCIC